MKLVLAVVLFLFMDVAQSVIDKKIEKCLVDCGKHGKAPNVCIAACTKNAQVINGVVKSVKPTTKAATTTTTTKKGATTKQTSTKKPLKEDSDVDRELAFLKEKERDDESETMKLEHEMLDEEKKIAEERKHSDEDAKEFLGEVKAPKKDMAKIKKAQFAMEQEQKEMLEEERKLRDERQHFIELQRDDALLKETEGELEHPGKEIRAFACLRNCLSTVHSALICKRKCQLEAKLAKLHPESTTSSAKPPPTHAPGEKCKGTCYGAQRSPDQCCNTCADVQAAYMARNWAIPTLDHFAQCKGVTKAVMSHTQLVGGRNRIFRNSWSQKQRDTNKQIHNIMFKHIERHTDTKPHFLPTKIVNASPAVVNPNVLKWQQYREKQHANTLKSGALPGMMMRMSEANRKRWAMLKVHHWMQPHKANIMKAQGVHQFVVQKKKLQNEIALKIKDHKKIIDKAKVVEKSKSELKKFLKTMVVAAKKEVDKH